MAMLTANSLITKRTSISNCLTQQAFLNFFRLSTVSQKGNRSVGNISLRMVRFLGISIKLAFTLVTCLLQMKAFLKVLHTWELFLQLFPNMISHTKKKVQWWWGTGAQNLLVFIPFIDFNQRLFFTTVEIFLLFLLWTSCFPSFKVFCDFLTVLLLHATHIPFLWLKHWTYGQGYLEECVPSFPSFSVVMHFLVSYKTGFIFISFLTLGALICNILVI